MVKAAFEATVDKCFLKMLSSDPNIPLQYFFLEIKKRIHQIKQTLWAKYICHVSRCNPTDISRLTLDMNMTILLEKKYMLHFCEVLHPKFLRQNIIILDKTLNTSFEVSKYFIPLETNRSTKGFRLVQCNRTTWKQSGVLLLIVLVCDSAFSSYLYLCYCSLYSNHACFLGQSEICWVKVWFTEKWSSELTKMLHDFDAQFVPFVTISFFIPYSSLPYSWTIILFLQFYWFPVSLIFPVIVIEMCIFHSFLKSLLSHSPLCEISCWVFKEQKH